jgi:hypothetical protein
MTSPTKGPSAPAYRSGGSRLALSFRLTVAITDVSLPACTQGLFRLVEPVTTAVLLFRRLNSLSFVCCMPSYSTDQTHLAGFEETSAWLLEVVVRDVAQPERQVGQYVDGGHHLENWQVSYGCQRVRRQMERRRPGPRALYRDILEMVFDQFADAWPAVEMRNDLEQEVRRRKRSPDLRQIGLAMFIAHRAGGNPNGSVIQGTDQRVDFSPQRRLCQFLGKTPKLATAGDRPLIIEEHAVGVCSTTGTASVSFCRRSGQRRTFPR